MKTAMVLSFCVMSLLWMTRETAYGQISIESLRSSIESANLEVVNFKALPTSPASISNNWEGSARARHLS